MDIEATSIAGVLIVRPKKFGDERGFFSEVFKQEALDQAGVKISWIQDNHAFSSTRGVVRGLHFQSAPYAQAKLVRVVRGAIYDVAVDIRAGSPTYGAYVGIELSAANWTQLLVPEGMAHGYCTLSDECEVLYKVSAPYAPRNEGGLLWNDPDLGIDWPINQAEATLNARDQSWTRFKDFVSPF
jgi:dTDP-4-dehydrorhamnose 3,5-epimerase